MFRPFIFLLLLLSLDGFAQTHVSGNQTGVWTKSNSPYFIDGSVSVAEGQALAIEPGVEIRSPRDGRMYIYGTLTAEGTAADSIRFTCPDSIDWAGAVIFGPASTHSVLRYTRFNRWGNTAFAGDIGVLQLLSADVTITHCLFSNCAASGIMMDEDSSPVINGNVFYNCPYAFSARPGSLSNVRNNTNARINIINANISTAVVWPAPGTGSYYIIGQGFTILQNASLTIQPGAHIQSVSATGGINVYGNLVAKGNATDSIFFDTPNNTTCGGTIVFNRYVTSSLLQFVHINRWGNTSFAGDIGALRLLSTGVTITNTVISNNAATGIMADEDISPVITDNVFYNCPRAINGRPGSFSNTARNTNANIYLINSNISNASTLPKPGPGSFYVLDAGFTVIQGATLTIEPGTIVKSASPADHINVYGTLVAKGTAADSIRFVAIDGSTYGGSLVFAYSSTHSVLQFVAFNRWGNTSYAGDIGALWLLTSSVTISNCLFSNAQATGIMANEDISPVITGNVFLNCPSAIKGRPGSFSNVSNNTNAHIYLINSNVSDTAVLPRPGAGSFYILDRGFTILQRGMLTIQPGVTIKSGSPSDQLNVYGTLVAKGTVTDSIRFVSADDNSYGGSIIFARFGNNSILQFASFNRWGNTSFAGDIGALWLLTSSVTISNCLFSNAQATGIMANENITPVITGNTFHNCPYAIKGQPGSFSNMSNNTNANIYLINSNVSSDALLPKPGPGSFYLLDQGFTILQGATLTIQPGVLIKSGSAADHINVYGTLTARGTETDSIRFVSVEGIAHGGTAIFTAASTNSALQFVAFKNWGNISYAGDIGALWLLTSSVSITNCTFANAEATGIMANEDISPVITGNVFYHCPRAMYGRPGGFSHISGNTNAVVCIANANISNTATLPKPGPGSFYLLNAGFTITSTGTLTILPGVEIRSGSAADYINVYGQLIAIGETNDSIRFTSTDNSSYGGCLAFTPGAGNSVLQFVSINRWGNTAYAGDIGAVRLQAASVAISNCTFSNAASYGLFTSLTAPVKIRKSSFVNNKTGIFAETGRPVFDSCTIAGNKEWGINNISGNTADTIDARNCWWGDAGGPFHPVLNPQGPGNKVSDKVLFKPWSITSSAVVTVSVRALLQGAYNTADGLMTDSLRAGGLLPPAEPYTAMGFVAVNHTVQETAVASLFDRSGNTAITDWVWLELRSNSNPAQVIATRCALLRRDGWVKDMDGLSPVSFGNVAGGNYYIAIRHRNHLGVMTAGAVALSAGNTTPVDFTNPATVTYGAAALKNSNGVMVMWAGDVNKDGKIKYNGASNDKDAILSRVGSGNPNNIIYGYERADLNLDGKVKYNGASNDKTIILDNVGVDTPDNIITEQLP